MKLFFIYESNIHIVYRIHTNIYLYKAYKERTYSWHIINGLTFPCFEEGFIACSETTNQAHLYNAYPT